MTQFDRVALAVMAIYGLVWVVGLFGFQVPAASFLRVLFYLAVAYLAFRSLTWLRREGLWSLRNRLIVAYIFLAVVPVVLLLAMGMLSAYLVYSQLGAHLLQDDLQKRTGKLAVTAEMVLRARLAGVAEASPMITSLLQGAARELPGVKLQETGGEELLRRYKAENAGRFAGVVQLAGELVLEAITSERLPDGRRVAVALSLPLSEEFLEQIAPELGPIQLTVIRPAAQGDPPEKILRFADREFLSIAQIASRKRRLPAPTNWRDIEVTGFSNLEAVIPDSPAERTQNPVLVSFSARPSQLGAPLFRSLGAFGDFASVSLFFMVIVFLVLEVAALRFGIQWTRNITRAVDELSSATQRVQAGDFSHTVRIQQRDQLGALGESFNEMTSSIATLIEEQRQRQRLENELSIAREVQAQLFPQKLPQVPGVELAAVCRAARVVSGDYYDFISLGPQRLAFAIADISGKGISAALLMASLQAALRSQVQAGQLDWNNTAALVSRLNRHLFLNTSIDRYATFFYAVYDAATRTLHFTNAGHLPPVYLVGEEAKSLEEGGMVVGLFDDVPYEQGTIHIEPGAVLVAYSDGLVEAENVYGEEFGRSGVLEEIVRRRHEPARQIAESLVQAAEEWAGSPEQGDDMTVVVARLS